MKENRPATIAQYIKAAPDVARPHLLEMYAILKAVAPNAEETIKWGNPFFIEPRFLFAFSAHKMHLSFAPSPEALQAFLDEVKHYQSTHNFLKIQYSEPLPKALIRKIAKHRMKLVSKRDDDGFW